MTTGKERHYLDACVLLAFLNQVAEPERYQECLPVMKASERGEINAFTSTLSLSEVIFLKGIDNENIQEEIIETFFRSPWLTMIAYEPEVALISRRIARKYRTKPMDSNHLASALKVQAKVFHTIDERLIKNLEGAISLEPEFSEPMVVQRPTGFQIELGL